MHYKRVLLVALLCCSVQQVFACERALVREEFDQCRLLLVLRPTLYRAVSYVEADDVRFLLQQGADARYTDEAGRSLLFHVIKPDNWFACNIWASNESVRIAKMLFDYGAVDAQEVCDNVPLIVHAAGSGLVEIAKLLVRAGADVNYRLDSSYKTALVTAVLCRHVDMVDFLLQAGAKKNLTFQGNAPLRIAQKKIKEFQKQKRLVEAFEKEEVCERIEDMQAIIELLEKK